MIKSATLFALKQKRSLSLVIRPINYYAAFVLLLVATLNVEFLYAAPDDSASASTTQRVDEINALVESRSKDLDQLLAQQRTLEAQLKEQQAAVKKIQNQEGGLKAELQKTKSQVDSLQGELTTTETHIAEVGAQSRARLRVLYMQKTDEILASIFSVSDQSHLRRNAYFLSKINERDGKLISEFLVLKKQKQDKVLSLAKVIEEQSKIQTKITSQRELLTDNLRKQENTVKTIRAQKSKLEDAIASMKAQALRLETVLTSLTGKDGASNASSKERVDSFKRGSDVRSGGPYVGLGLDGLKGRLSLPVAGRPVHKAAKASENSDKMNFREMVTSKGLEFITKSAASVRVVAPGKVIFSGKMPGLGNILIVDHGSRSYSLYGRLASTLVKVGQELNVQDELGVTGNSEVDSSNVEKGNFYFEIRKNGLPVDTRKYFASL